MAKNEGNSLNSFFNPSQYPGFNNSLVMDQHSTASFRQPVVSQSSSPFLSNQPMSIYQLASLNTYMVQNMLEDNKSLILKGLEDMNNDKFEDCVHILDRLNNNLQVLASAADLQSNSRYVLRENRELISKEDLQDFYKRYPYQDQLFSAEDILGTHKPTVTMKERPKQVKNPWTEEEQTLFLQALQKYGQKNLKEIADYIKTRTIVQVRSHLQKHIIKEGKKQFDKEIKQIEPEPKVVKIEEKKEEEEVLKVRSEQKHSEIKDDRDRNLRDTQKNFRSLRLLAESKIRDQIGDQKDITSKKIKSKIIKKKKLKKTIQLKNNEKPNHIR